MKNNKKNIPSYWIYVIVIGTVLGVALGLWLGSPLNEEGLQMNLDTVWHFCFGFCLPHCFTNADISSQDFYPVIALYLSGYSTLLW